MKSLCLICKQYRSCRKICDLILPYVNQDYVPQRALPIPFPMEAELEHPSSIYLTKTEKKITTLLGSGLTREEVAQVLKIQRNTLRRHIYVINKKRQE